jgi:hypothetical protein
MLQIQTLIVSTLLAALHPFFISSIEMKHNVNNKNIEISIRVFADDFEKTINKNNHTKIDIATSATKPEVNSLIAKYIQNKLLLHINNKPQAIKYIGYEIVKESIWIYAEVDDIATIKKANITCNFLYDFEQTQSNIITVKANNTEQSYKLDNPKNKAEFSF